VPQDEIGDKNLRRSHETPPQDKEQADKTRKEIAHRIHEFIQNTQSGALGVTGSVLLIFAAISMLSRIEDTFNDIWGVAQCRSWFTRIVVYWSLLSLAPLLVVSFGLAGGPQLESTRRFLAATPFVGGLVLQLVPVSVLCLAFASFYLLMPNTRVHWKAALGGGLVAGLLFHINNTLSVLYVSRVVSNSKIYGSLGLIPVLMIGLYFSWLILLFGAQVAYGFQNLTAYLEEKHLEGIDQRGREFVALRLLALIGQRFLSGAPPAGMVESAKQLGVPTRLVQQVMQTLCAAQLVVEAAGSEPAYVPSRPLEKITCHDVLRAMRASPGFQLTTGEEPTEIAGEFQRIEEAERQAASSVTILALAQRSETRRLGPGDASGTPKT
jgi:membrane protein